MTQYTLIGSKGLILNLCSHVMYTQLAEPSSIVDEFSHIRPLSLKLSWKRMMIGQWNPDKK